MAADAILAWDGEYTPEATATVLFKFWRLACGSELDLAPLAAGDPTRCHAVTTDGRVLLPGLTRPGAEAACGWLCASLPARTRVWGE